MSIDRFTDAGVVPELADKPAEGNPDSASVNGYAPLVLLTLTGTTTGEGEPSVYSTRIGFGPRVTAGASPIAPLSTFKLNVFSSELPLASDKMRDMKNSPELVGVPESTPNEFKLRPGGKSEYGARVSLYGAVPPENENNAEYELPTKAGGRESGVRASRFTTSEQLNVNVCPEGSVAVSWKL